MRSYRGFRKRLVLQPAGARQTGLELDRLASEQFGNTSEKSPCSLQPTLLQALGDKPMKQC